MEVARLRTFLTNGFQLMEEGAFFLYNMSLLLWVDGSGEVHISYFGIIYTGFLWQREISKRRKESQDGDEYMWKARSLCRWKKKLRRVFIKPEAPIT